MELYLQKFQCDATIVARYDNDKLSAALCLELSLADLSNIYTEHADLQCLLQTADQSELDNHGEHMLLHFHNKTNIQALFNAIFTEPAQYQSALMHYDPDNVLQLHTTEMADIASDDDNYNENEDLGAVFFEETPDNPIFHISLQSMGSSQAGLCVKFYAHSERLKFKDLFAPFAVDQGDYITIRQGEECSFLFCVQEYCGEACARSVQRMLFAERKKLDDARSRSYTSIANSLHRAPLAELGLQPSFTSIPSTSPPFSTSPMPDQPPTRKTQVQNNSLQRNRKRSCFAAEVTSEDSDVSDNELQDRKRCKK